MQIPLTKEGLAQLAKRMRTKLPREIQDIIYDFVNDNINDIIITTREARSGVVSDRNWPSYLRYDHEFAFEAVIHYYRKAKFVILNVDDTCHALRVDVFGLSCYPLDYAHNIQIDIHLQQHTVKASKFASSGKLTGRDCVYDDIITKLQKFKELKNASHARLHIRLTTSGSRAVWFKEAVVTMDKIRPMIFELQEFGMTITVEHWPMLQDPRNLWGQEDLTPDFKLGDEEWKEAQKRRFNRGNTSA